jgi:hypothetical protein
MNQPTISGRELAAIEAELDVMQSRICEIANLANSAEHADRALMAERKMQLFSSAFIDLMSGRLSPEEYRIFEDLRHAGRRGDA